MSVYFSVSLFQSRVLELNQRKASMDIRLHCGAGTVALTQTSFMILWKSPL